MSVFDHRGDGGKVRGREFRRERHWVLCLSVISVVQEVGCGIASVSDISSADGAVIVMSAVAGYSVSCYLCCRCHGSFFPPLLYSVGLVVAPLDDLALVIIWSYLLSRAGHSQLAFSPQS